MSLTSELANSSSPVTKYLKFVGAIAADTIRGTPWAEPCKRLLGLDTLPSKAVVTAVPGADAGMVGTAFDYRLRLQLAPCRSRDFVAWKGAALLNDLEPSTESATSRFFSHLDTLTSRLSPAGQILPDEDETLLCTYCAVLAQFESVFRTRGQWTPHFSSVSTMDSGPEWEPLLQLAPDAVVDEVVNLSRSASNVMSPLIPYVANGSLPYNPNPEFAGSGAVGGADADFIISGTLFELKTSKTLDVAAIRKALLQLLGYSLLDYSDEFEIRRVGVYFARQAWVKAWPLWQLIFPPADVVQLSFSRTEPTDRVIAARLQKLRGLMERVVNGEAISLEESFS